MGQIKNIKLHIVTDIKSQSTTMASRQVAARAVNWTALASRIPKDPKYSAGFEEMRIKFETAKGSLNSTPEKPVPIDWDHYKSVVKNQALLANLEAERANQTSKDDAMREELASTTAEAQAKIDTLKNRKSYDIMTVEEYFEHEPEIAEQWRSRHAEATKYRTIWGYGHSPQQAPEHEPWFSLLEEAKKKERKEKIEKIKSLFGKKE